MTADSPSKTTSMQAANREETDLLPAKRWRRDQYDLILAHGYRLRPRYRPGWVAPWKETGRRRYDFEDGIYNLVDYVLDASRVSDGKVVSIKRVSVESPEISIALYLSSDSDDSKNHCVPVLDHFSDPGLPQYSFLVMPVLRKLNDPPFWSIEEVVDFIQQTLEGLSHMHTKGVAHSDLNGDLASLNIMLEASALYPCGFHPVDRDMDPSGLKMTPKWRRRDVKGVKYYFIDFGISTRFDENVKRENRLVVGIDGQDREVPELSSLELYDPFAVDVFTLGNAFRKKFLNVYDNISFISSIVESMTAREPRDRPSAEEALAHFRAVVAKQHKLRLRWALKEKDSTKIIRIMRNIKSIIHEGV